ncbi:hypothetical protein WJX79_002583 [Trebouxia sp. C0005]
MYFDSPSAGNKVFVGGLAGITHRDLYDGFSWFGPIANVKIVTDQYTGGPRGFGSVCKAQNTHPDVQVLQSLQSASHPAPKLQLQPS